ncbi:hypothetical protein ACFLYT_01370 [Nanoarchaeota archaeon]
MNEKKKSENLAKPNQPEKRFSTGAIQAAVWKNEIKKDDTEPGSYRTITLSRRYKDKDGTWKSTSSLRVNDLPKATLVLHKAYEYIVLKTTDSDIISEEEVF